jgi:hypothetical protein
MLGVVGSVPVLPELTMLTLKNSPYLGPIMESLSGEMSENGPPGIFGGLCLHPLLSRRPFAYLAESYRIAYVFRSA